MAWLEVSLSLNGEAAEAVAEVLGRFAPGAVAIESAYGAVSPGDDGGPVGSLLVRAFLPAGPELAATKVRIEEALWHLGQVMLLPPPRFTSVPETDWAEAWKAASRPIRVGDRFVVTPTWHDPPLGPDDLPLLLDPGMAFGTGTHPTTHLCLEAIERYLRPGQTVVDLGTGSGILAIAAARLGAGPTLALDIDDEAVRTARQNAAVNGVADRIRVERGSLADLRAGCLCAFHPADLLVANLRTRIIVELLTQGLVDAVQREGYLILSGILAAEAHQVREALEGHDAHREAEEGREEWVAIVVRRCASLGVEPAGELR